MTKAELLMQCNRLNTDNATLVHHSIRWLSSVPAGTLLVVRSLSAAANQFPVCGLPLTACPLQQISVPSGVGAYVKVSGKEFQSPPAGGGEA